MTHLTNRFGKTAMLTGLALLLAAPALGQETAKPQKKAKPEQIYDESADAKADVAAAVGKAKKDNKRALVMFGGNWCGWCHKLHGLFKSNRDIGRLLLYEYELVMVDIGRFDKNTDLAKEFGAEIKGVPFLTILDGNGEVLANQETGSLEKGKPPTEHDPEKVKAFLSKHVAEPWDAEKVLADGLKRAKSDGKMVFLHFGAPWCGWCRRLEEFMAREEIANVLARDFIDVKIDRDRMARGKDIEKRFRKGKRGGIPWFAFLDAEGEILVTADGPKGNVGFPVEEHEIAHFIDMLKQTTKNITADQIEQIEKALQDSAKRILGDREG